ncbi:4595_t:CDS:1, partial [Gigaspora margarita]
ILLTKENVCPVKNYKKSIEILDQFSRWDSESSTASIVRRMEKYNIRSPREISEKDMSDVNNREGEDNLFKNPHKRSFVDTSKNKSPSKKSQETG